MTLVAEFCNMFPSLYSFRSFSWTSAIVSCKEPCWVPVFLGFVCLLLFTSFSHIQFLHPYFTKTEKPFIVSFCQIVPRPKSFSSDACEAPPPQRELLGIHWLRPTAHPLCEQLQGRCSLEYKDGLVGDRVIRWQCVWWVALSTGEGDVQDRKVSMWTCVEGSSPLTWPSHLIRWPTSKETLKY